MHTEGSPRPYGGFWIFLLLAVGLVALVGVGLIAFYEWRYAERVYQGVEVAGAPLGGLTLAEAVDAIRDRWTPYPGAPLVLRYGKQTWTLSAADLGVAVDAVGTASAAFAIGRRGQGTGATPADVWTGLRTDLVEQWSALQAGTVISPTLRFDEARVWLTLQGIAQQVEVPAREGALTITGLEVRGTAGQTGRRVDTAAVAAAITQAVRTGQSGAIDLIVEESQPAVLSVDAAVARATTLLRRSLLLSADGLGEPQRFAVDAATLSGWLTLRPVPDPEGVVGLDVQLDREPVTALVAQLAKQIDRPAYDAVLDFDRKANQVVIVQPSQVGQQLDAATAVAAIEAAVLAGVAQPGPIADTAVITTSTTITLPLTLIQPKIDSNRIAEMGIVEQVSEGTTYFAGSSRERVLNILNAAGKFQGAVIAPDAEFSFYKVVGDVTTANGFVDSLIIVGDRTETGVGGGVCQVSTTVFRAAFWGGFPIIERYPHGYVVGWYGEPGLDASIFTPTADFRFLNDTGHYLLVKPEVDTKRGRITFYFYGTKPDRTVEAEKPVITNTRPAPQPRYQEDATLPAGTIKQVDWAKDGIDVLVKRTVRYGDGRVKEDKIVSKYRPWQAVYLYGPGTQLPPEATNP